MVTRPVSKFILFSLLAVVNIFSLHLAVGFIEDT